MNKYKSILVGENGFETIASFETKEAREAFTYGYNIAMEIANVNCYNAAKLDDIKDLNNEEWLSDNFIMSEDVKEIKQSLKEYENKKIG